MEIFADALHAIVEAENLQSLVMIGHSMGGYITLAYAEKYAFEFKRVWSFSFICIRR